MRWPEVALLAVVAICATVTAALTAFEPLAVYTGILGWGGARSVQAAGRLEVQSPIVRRETPAQVPPAEGPQP